MKRELIIAYLIILFVAIDLWLWVPFESSDSVDWFLFVESFLKPHWYIKFTTGDLLVFILSVSLYTVSTDIRLIRVSKAISAYFAFKCVAMWCFDDKLAMSPYFIALFTYCFVAISLGNKFLGLTEIVRRNFKGLIGILKRYVKGSTIC